MKISNELKVGILALSAIFVLVWGYSYLKGQDLFSDKKIIYAEYDNVFGLTKSSTVKISGINVGLVTNIQLKEDGSQMVSVEMEIEPGIKIPKKTIAELVDQSALGGKTIILRFEGTCEGEGCLQTGDVLEGKTVGLIESMTGDLDPYIKKAESSWEMVDSMIKGFKAGQGGEGGLGLEKTLNDFQAILANLSVTTNKLNGLIANSSSQIEGSLTNVNTLTKGLAESEDDIQKALANVSKFSDRLEGIELEETVDSAQMTFASVNHSLATVDAAILDIQQLIKKINEGDGTVSKLLNDDELYGEVTKLLLSAKRLTDDLQLHPERYTAVLKKKRAAFSEPTAQQRELMDKIDELNKKLEETKEK